MLIPLSSIVANPQQPRSLFDEDELEILADSLTQHGLLNPVSVTGPYEGGWFVLNDGERRVRAARLAGWTEIEAYVRPIPQEDSHESLILALVGNLQRSDMGFVDEAHAYQCLHEAGMTMEEIGNLVGRSVSTVSNRIALLDGTLCDTVLEHLNAKRLPFEADMLRALRRLNDEQQRLLVNRAVVNGSSGVSIRSAATRLANAAPLRNVRQRNRQSRRHATQGGIAPALAVGNVDLGESFADVVEAIIPICDRCGMGLDSTGKICRDCPLVALVVRLADVEREAEKTEAVPA